MSQDWVDFKEIKEKVTIEMVLIHYGLLDTLKQTPKGFKGPCPIHKGSHPNQFHADPIKNRWNCFGGCDMEKLEGHVIGFVAALENISLREAALLLAEWYGLTRERPGQQKKKPSGTVAGKATEAPPVARKEIPKSNPSADSRPEPENKELSFELKNLGTDHPFFQKRGILPETITHFGLGFCSRGMMQDRIVFPLHNREGKLIGYTGRTVKSITDENPKWLLPPGLVKPKVLLNFDRVVNISDTLIIVEGPLDLLAVHQAGYPNVVALLGKELLIDPDFSYDQRRLITENFDKVVVLLDGDTDGQKAALDCLNRLIGQVFTRLITLPNEKDPSDLAPEELKNLLDFLK